MRSRVDREADVLVEEIALFREHCLLLCRSEEQRARVKAGYIIMLAGLRQVHGAPTLETEGA